jgi:hypothetical protein
MNVDNLILRQTDYPPLVNKDDFLDNADFDSNMINIYDDLVALCLTNGVIAYDISTEYDDAVINYATHDGRLWKFVNAVPASNVTPGTNELYWIEVFPTELAHRKNSDTILDEGGANEVTASEIRAFIDAGLTSTTNLSLSEQTDVSLKINSSTGSDVTLLGATETTAGLLISDDKQKLNQLSGINSGDQTLESLGAEATANKVIDFSVIDNITFPTTEAVANKITSDVVDLVDAQLTNYATTVQLATKENTITAGTTAQYWRGDKSWQTLDKTAVGLENVANVDTTNASNISSGTLGTARMGSGTADSTTYLRGDNTWQTPTSSNIYTSDGTLSGARTVTMSGNGLIFTGGQTTIKGSGTTSATKSLSVQNSAGTTTLECFDNIKTYIYQSGNVVPAIVVSNIANTESQSLRIFNYNNGGSYGSALISNNHFTLQSEVGCVEIKGGNSTASFFRSVDMYGGTTNLGYRLDNSGRSIFTSNTSFRDGIGVTFQANDKIVVDGFNSAWKNSSSVPSTNITDHCRLYASDQTAGNSCLHTRTENGAIVKLYQETTGVASSTFVENTGNNVKEDSTFDGYTVAQVVKALRNLGILA